MLILALIFSALSIYLGLLPLVNTEIYHFMPNSIGGPDAGSIELGYGFVFGGSSALLALYLHSYICVGLRVPDFLVCS